MCFLDFVVANATTYNINIVVDGPARTAPKRMINMRDS